MTHLVCPAGARQLLAKPKHAVFGTHDNPWFQRLWPAGPGPGVLEWACMRTGDPCQALYAPVPNPRSALGACCNMVLPAISSPE
jgi:hypothetical protein